MTRLLEEGFSSLAALPGARRGEVTRITLRLTGVDQPPIQLTPEEEADLAKTGAEIERGELATSEQLCTKWAKHGR